MPANWWHVDLEIRKLGAIGEFTWETYTIRADSTADATRYALDDAHMDGFETRGCREPQRLRA